MNSPPEPSKIEEKVSVKILRDAQDQFFRDGRRQIDFILAYEVDDEARHGLLRDFFQAKLRLRGLQMEYEISQTKDGKKIGFVKIHAPDDILAKHAERMCFKHPLKDVEKPEFSNLTFVEEMCNCTLFSLPEEFLDSYEVQSNYEAVFKQSKRDMFKPYSEKSFFEPAQRIRLVAYLLRRTQSEPGQFFSPLNSGIDRLLRKQVYVAAYPIHDGGKCYKCERVLEQPISNWNVRRLLHKYWQHSGMKFKHQPLITIRDYFGFNVSYYFAWMGAFTRALIPPAILGLVCFAYGISTAFTDQVRLDVCQAENVTMCPYCETNVCSPWKLNESCMFQVLGLIFSHEFTIAYAVFITLWGTWFLVYWKRKEAVIKYDSQDVNVDANDQRIRMEYEACATERVRNPVTRRLEPSLPKTTRCSWVAVSAICTLALVLLLLMVMVLVIFIRGVIFRGLSKLLRKYEGWHEYARLFSVVFGVVISLAIIVAAEKLYKLLAYKLTRYECPRTKSDFESSYTYKVLAFQLVNFYMPSIYVAYIKGRLHAGALIEDRGFFTVEDCGISGCMSELALMLIFTMTVKQIFQTMFQYYWRQLVKTVRKRKHDWENKKQTQWEKDFSLIEPPELPFVDEYVRMLIQFGFVVFFSAAFPLAPFFVLINNVFEMRKDANKWTYVYRRMVPEVCYHGRPWYKITKSFAIFSILANACMIAFTSHIIPKILYRIEYGNHTMEGYIQHTLSFYKNESSNISCHYFDYRESEPPYEKTIVYWHVLTSRLAFIVVFMVVTHFLQKLIFFIPSVPSKLANYMRREQYVAWQMFYDTETRTVSGREILEMDEEDPHDLQSFTKTTTN